MEQLRNLKGFVDLALQIMLLFLPAVFDHQFFEVLSGCQGVSFAFRLAESYGHHLLHLHKIMVDVDVGQSLPLFVTVHYLLYDLLLRREVFG